MAKAKKTTGAPPAKAKVSKAKATASPFAFDFSASTITAALARIKANDAAQEALVHATVQRCICQIMAHRNTDFATKLLNTLGKAWRTTSLVKHLEHFVPVKLKSSKDSDTGTVTRSFKVLAEDDPAWIAARKRYDANPAKFIDVPTFWDFDPEVTEFKPINFIAIIEQAVKRAERSNVYPKGHAKEGQPLSKEDAAKNNLLGLAQAKALISTIKGTVHAGSTAAH